MIGSTSREIRRVTRLVARGRRNMRRTLGTAVFSGMLGVTLFGVFLTPVFFYVINRLGESGPFAAAPVRTLSSLLLLPIRLPMMLFRMIRPG